MLKKMGDIIIPKKCQILLVLTYDTCHTHMALRSLNLIFQFLISLFRAKLTSAEAVA